jgi:hypothetical protein
VEDPKRNNKRNSSGELILSIVNKKTAQGLTNEFDCDATLEPAELEVNKIKVKCACYTVAKYLTTTYVSAGNSISLQLKSKNVKHLLL